MRSRKPDLRARMIDHRQFFKLRLRDLADERDVDHTGERPEPIRESDDWEYEDEIWHGEMLGSAVFLRPRRARRQLRFMEVHLGRQPLTAARVLERIGLPLRLGMTRDEVAAATGAAPMPDPEVPWMSWFRVGAGEAVYTVNCAFQPTLDYLTVEPYLDRPTSRKSPKAAKKRTTKPKTAARTRKAKPDPPLWASSLVEGECKYVRLVSGEILFVDPHSYGSHLDATRTALGVTGLSVPAGAVKSAGRIHVDRKKRTVSMGERDSRTLGVRSAPGDEDARAIAAFLFGEGVARR